MKPEIAPMVWYRPETYARILAICEDRHVLPKTYAEWLAKAKEGRQILEKRGLRVILIDVEPEHLKAWCAETSKNLNSHARAEYAVFMALKLLDGESAGHH